MKQLRIVDIRTSLACAAAGVVFMLLFTFIDKPTAHAKDNKTQEPLLPSLWLVQTIILIVLSFPIVLVDYVSSAADTRHIAMWANIGLVVAVHCGGILLLWCFEGKQSVTALLQLHMWAQCLWKS